MSRFRSRGIPVGVVLFGLGLGVLAPVPTQALVQTLVLSQASLLAIVISVSLLSVQSSQFAPLLSSLYRESTFERTIAKFGASILFDLALFGLPSAPAPPVRGLAVGVALGLAAWSFVSLFEIEGHMTAFLNPEPVLDDLADQVSFERYREFARSHRESGRVARNPLLEILQIAQTSLDQRDNYGALQAVAALEDGTERILGEYRANGVNDPETLHRLFDYWDQLGRSAVDGGADDVLHHVAEAEAEVARTALDGGTTDAFGAATGTLARFCERAVAADRIEPRYVESLGELLVAAVEADDDRGIALALDHVADLREAMEAVGPSVAPALSVLTVQLLRAQRRLVEVYPETIAEERHARPYALLEEAADRCVADLLVTDADVSAVGRAFAEVGVAAAETDHQWIVRRVATRIVDLRAAAEGRYDEADDHVEALHHAGGEDGVETAFDHIRETYGDGPAPEMDDPVSRLD